MGTQSVTPILNVSDLAQSFAWFEKLGWQKAWDWGSPPTFGAVCDGSCEIFLALGAQGGRGKSELSRTGGAEGADAAEKGVWLSVLVDDVDAVHAACVAADLDVTWPPTDEPWGLREMHVRHPDGHVLRVGSASTRTERRYSSAGAAP